MGRMIRLAEHYAHRGFHNKPDIPENSMAAFRRAVECGFPSEFDVHLIADGSLVIFHDNDLERETGVAGKIEGLTIEELRELRLEGTDERIPLFDEVLDLYEETGLPLLIELKAAGGNHSALAEAVCSRLDRYSGDYVIESFDPRALLAVRRLRPDTVIGQLSQNFFVHKEGLPLYQSAVLTNMLLNRLIKPEFIAYRYTDRRNRALRKAVDRKGVPEVSWTIQSPDEYREATDAGCIPVFEGFDPRITGIRSTTKGR